MHDIIEIFSDLITDYTILTDETKANGDKIFKAKLKLKDNTELDIYERLRQLDRNYSYNWRKGSDTLIIRWDNAKHHPALDNYPHHKHLETNQKVSPSEEMTLRKVLKYISGTLAIVLIIWAVISFL